MVGTINTGGMIRRIIVGLMITKINGLAGYGKPFIEKPFRKYGIT